MAPFLRENSPGELAISSPGITFGACAMAADTASFTLSHTCQ